MAESAIDRASSHNHKSSRPSTSRYERTDHDRQKDRRHRSRSRSRSREHYDRKRKSRGDDVERERDEPRSKRHTSEARSRSPRRDRDRGSTRQRSPPRGPKTGGGRDGGRERERSRDRDRDRNGVRPTRTNGAVPNAPPSGPRSKTTIPRDTQMQNGSVDEDEDDEAAMQKVMGFGAFRSTKNTKVPGNSRNYGVRKEKKTEYRQYMNRQGGFNRPLSPGR